MDRVLAVGFQAPASYTGEDMLELGCHGGALVPQLVLDAVCAAGARPAEPGEFTRRAFLNGKIDLLQAEAILDLIDARSPAMHRAALFQLERGLSSRIESLRRDLIELQALLAYDIDFPEEDDGPVASERIERLAGELAGAIAQVLEMAPEGELLRDGALTVIAGRPNTGKSSLFNYLLGLERAIVTEEAGTTRDAIEAVVSIGGFPFRLVDTAGLREGVGHIEGKGIEVARGYLNRADLVLFCMERGREADQEEVEFLRNQSGRRGQLLVLGTKADLCADGIPGPESEDAEAGSTECRKPHPGESTARIHVSVRSGEGVRELRAALIDAAYAGIHTTEEAPLVTHGRQVRCLKRAAQEIEAFRVAREGGLPSELASTHVQEATVALENLLGVVTTEEVLDAVFGEFCVGK